MTTPVKPEPISRVLTGDEWEAAQYAPHRLTSDPKKPLPPGRVLTGDEWEQAQRAGSLRKLTFPAMPKFAADATRRLNPNAGAPDKTPTEYLGSAVRTLSDVAEASSAGLPTAGIMGLGAVLGRQVVAPVVEHPIVTAAMLNPVGAVAGGLMAAHTVAKYGWQVAHESQMTPEERAEALKDPDRVSGEAAAVQAVMLGLGAIAGVRAARGIGDVGAGMMEAGAKGLGTFKDTFGADALKSLELKGAITEHAKTYFETEKGAEVLGTTAGAHGLPETASPFPPASALDVAWKQGHAAAKPQPDPYSVPGVQSGEDLGAFGRRLGVAKDTRYANAVSAIGDLSKPVKFSSDNMDWIVHRSTRDPSLIQLTTVGRDAAGDPFPLGHREYATIEEAAREIASNPHAKPEVAPPVTPEPTPTANVAGPGEPGYKGPAALYGRLSDDALATEYRALLEKRTAEEPGAQAPLWDAEREARAVEQIENRRRPDGSLAPADKRALANLQAAQGEMYGVGRHTFESAAAERRLTEINKHITAIEKEIGNRGKNPTDFMQAPQTGQRGILPEGHVPGEGDAQSYWADDAQAHGLVNGEPGITREKTAGRDMFVFRDQDGVPRGRAAVYQPSPESDPGINVHVDPSFHRQGIATRLYDAVRKAGYDVEALSAGEMRTAQGQAFAEGRQKARQSAQGGGGLTPIEGTGETVQRGLSRSTTKGLADTRRAIEDDLSSTLGDLPEYRRLNMKDQATKALDFLERDPEAARRVALGDEAAPEGLQPESVFVALRNQARREGDVATLLDLAHGGLTEQATTMGQRIRILGERDPEDPVAAMQSVMDKRSGGKGAEKAIASTVKEIEQAGLANLDSLLDFFDSVKC